jgi:hypothetical protein
VRKSGDLNLYVYSTDIKSVFVCDVCDSFFLMFLVSVPISVQDYLNIPGYVSGFISTLCVKVHHFLGGVKGL